MSRNRMLRATLGWVGLLLGLGGALAGCGQPAESLQPEQTVASATASIVASAGVSPGVSITTTSSPVPEVTSSTGSAVPGAQTFEAVILGPGDRPLAPADIAPQLFHDEPSVLQVLETALPAGIAEKEGRYVDQGAHLILVLDIGGAAKSATGIEVYGEAWV